MAEKKKGTKKKKAPASKKKAAARKKKKAAKGGDDNVVSLAELADEAGVSTQQARQKLRAADIERPEGKRWGWPPKSKGLGAAKKALGI